MSCVICKRLGQTIGAIGLVALAAVLAGCGSGSESQTAANAEPEIRGEPIRGDAIAPATGTEVAAEASSPAGESKTEPALADTAPAPGTSVATSDKQTAGSAPPANPAPAEEVGTPDKPLPVAFEKLASFQYDLPEGPAETNASSQASTQIPEGIRALNDQFVSLKGFMLPLKVEKGLVTELLIMRDQSMCCYGTVPKINEWVSVKMVGPGVKPVMDQAVTLFGKFKVGEMYENGYLVGIYAMDGERMAGPLDM